MHVACSSSGVIAGCQAWFSFNPLMLANKLYLCATPDWPLSADSRLPVLSIRVSQIIFPSILVWMKNDYVRKDTDDVHMTKGGFFFCYPSLCTASWVLACCQMLPLQKFGWCIIIHLLHFILSLFFLILQKWFTSVTWAKKKKGKAATLYKYASLKCEEETVIWKCIPTYDPVSIW